MKQFMVHFILPESLDESFMRLVPSQRARVNELFEEGQLISYTLSLDRSQLWATIGAEDEFELVGIVNSFPLTQYMEYDIHELFFNELVQKEAFPAFSLN